MRSVALRIWLLFSDRARFARRPPPLSHSLSLSVCLSLAHTHTRYRIRFFSDDVCWTPRAPRVVTTRDRGSTSGDLKREREREREGLHTGGHTKERKRKASSLSLVCSKRVSCSLFVTQSSAFWVESLKKSTSSYPFGCSPGCWHSEF